MPFTMFLIHLCIISFETIEVINAVDSVMEVKWCHFADEILLQNHDSIVGDQTSESCSF